MVRTLSFWRALAVAGIALSLLASMPSARAQAAGILAKAPTTGELALMPEWCIDTQDGPYGGPEGREGLNRSPRARQWVSAIGTDFWHMHHYCRGLRDMLRLQRAGLSKRDREMLTARAINEFEYIINNCKTTMPLMPEVHLKKGEMHLLRSELTAASESFEISRKLKPDYWPAYDRWIAVLIGLKQFNQARALAQEGLVYSVGQPNLIAQLAAINAAAGRDSGPRAAASPSSSAAR